jgi:hypothetical protein
MRSSINCYPYLCAKHGRAATPVAAEAQKGAPLAQTPFYPELPGIPRIRLPGCGVGLRAGGQGGGTAPGEEKDWG